MNRKQSKRHHIVLFIALILALLMINSCITEPEPDFTTGTVKKLTLDTSADGVITSSNKEQWFKFTATATTQYITVTFGTLSSVYGQLYDRDGNSGNLLTYGPVDPPYTGYFREYTLTKGKIYYIKITPNPSHDSGAYRIRFSNSQLSPDDRKNAIVLSNDVWDESELIERGQTYKFTASAYTQHFHIMFGTLTNLSIRFFDKDGIMLGEDTDDKHLTGDSDKTLSFIQMLTVTHEYYVLVFKSSTDYGTYKIAFSNKPIPPDP